MLRGGHPLAGGKLFEIDGVSHGPFFGARSVFEDASTRHLGRSMRSCMSEWCKYLRMTFRDDRDD